MPSEEQDMLTQALLSLENELTSFGTIQAELKKAHDQLTQAEKEWEALTREQQKTALELVEATRGAIAATRLVISQTESLTGVLMPMAKAMEQINFPMRLDKIDLGVSTQASTLATVQGAIDRGFGSVSAGIEKAEKTTSNAFSAVSTGLEKAEQITSNGFLAVSESQSGARKREIAMLVLLVINTIALIGFGVFHFVHRVKAAGM